MTYFPRNHDDIKAIIAQAMESERPLCITGTQTKSGLHEPVRAEEHLSLAEMSGIVDYEPEELVLVVRSGTRLDEINALLEQHNQMLAFEPADYSGLLSSDHSGTIGGVIATNISGSRRISAGAARDYLLGFDAISGRCDQFKSGSRVMKNVTGYDLSKLMCGSYGRLAVLSELTLKVLPSPQTVQTICVTTDSLANAQAIVSKAFRSSVEPSGGAILPEAEQFASYVRIEGVAVSVADRVAALKNILEDDGSITLLDADESHRLWQNITNVEQFAPVSGQVWKLSIVPSNLAQIMAELSRQSEMSYFADWAGGLVWLNTHDPEAGSFIRTIIAGNGGGYAHLVRGDASDAISRFQPQPEQLSNLQARIKTAFDPLHILNRDIMGREQPSEPSEVR